MVNRRRDVPFCGVDLEAIQSKSPIFDKEALKLLHHYITERYEKIGRASCRERV